MKQLDPNEPIETKLTDEGVSVLTKAGLAGYPILRAAVDMLKLFDLEGFEEYLTIKGGGTKVGPRTVESRRAAYAYAWERAGKLILLHYNRDFTGTKGKGEEWKGE